MSDLDPGRAVEPHPVLRFVRRRLARGVPYGMGFTVAFAAVAALLFAFLAIAGAMLEADDIARFDDRAHDVIYQTVGPYESLIAGVTFFGNNATLIALVVLVSLGLVIGRRYWSAFRVVFASGLGGIVVVSLKQLFQRTRPLDQILPAHGYSFPSGHAFASTVFYGMMVYLVWRLTGKTWARVLATVLGPAMFLAIGLSRVYLNVHYLTDVLAGWAAGLAWLIASLLLIDTVERRTRSRREAVEEAARPEDASPEAMRSE